MKIITTPQNARKLSTIEAGDLFRLNDKIYMRTSDNANTDITCVSMSNGKLEYFYEQNLVEPIVNCKIIIE